MDFDFVKRFEFKYHISYLDYLVLKSRLSELMKLDKNALTSGGYVIRSLYFDNLQNEAYFDKINGVRLRKKLRLRMYNNDQSTLKLEIKKKCDDVVSKISVPIDKKTASGLIHNNFSITDLSSSLAIPEEFSFFIGSSFLRPVVMTEYMREAFCLNFNKIRVTFDTNAKKQENIFDFFNKDAEFVENKEIPPIILEIKFNNYLPYYFKNLFTFDSSQRLAISKYCLSRDLIY